MAPSRLLLAAFAGAVVAAAGGALVSSRPPAEAPLPRPSVQRVTRPLLFEENVGQAPAEAQFLAHTRQGVVWLSSTGMALEVERPDGTVATERLELAGAAQVRGLGRDEQTAKVSYFIGNEPSKWRTNVRTWDSVVFPGVWPGVDVVFRGTEGELEYDFVVQPGADVPRIALAFPYGAPVATEQGDLRLPSGLVSRRPTSFHPEGGKRRLVASAYEVQRDGVGFRVTGADARLPLVIDPVLTWSTYLGGAQTDHVNGIAVDSVGSVYVTGHTFSNTTFPLPGAYQPTFGGATDVFVTKYTSNGVMLWSTYLGGNNTDQGNDIGLDSSLNVYVAGETQSNVFPTENPVQAAYGGGKDGFLVRLSASGASLDFGTYLGNNGNDSVAALAVGPGGVVWVGGDTGTPGLTDTTGGTHKGSAEGFVSRIDTNDGGLMLTRLLGGQGNDYVYDIAVGPGDSLLVGGSTNSTPAQFFPVSATSYQTAVSGGADSFVGQVFADGGLGWLTYLGGSQNDSVYGIAAGPGGEPVVTGLTTSTDFPRVNAEQTVSGAGEDSFVAWIADGGTAVRYSTYLAGNANDKGNRIAVDAIGNAYVVGSTGSGDFPRTNAVQMTKANGNDAFLTVVSPAGVRVFSSYVGGNSNDSFNDLVVVGSSAKVYIGGHTASTDFPLAGPTQPDAGGSEDGLVLIWSFADGGADSGMPDAGTDAGVTDSGTPDSGTPDSGTPDSGTPDSGTPDSGTSFDGGTTADAGPDVDGGAFDSGVQDSGTPLTDGGVDAGAPDAGGDAGVMSDAGTLSDGGAADAGATADGGSTRVPPVVEVGCGCRAGSSGPMALLLLALAVVRARRRRMAG